MTITPPSGNVQVTVSAPRSPAANPSTTSADDPALGEPVEHRQDGLAAAVDASASGSAVDVDPLDVGGDHGGERGVGVGRRAERLDVQCGCGGCGHGATLARARQPTVSRPSKCAPCCACGSWAVWRSRRTAARSSRPRAGPRASCWPGSRSTRARTRGSSSRCASGPTCPRRAPAPACARRCTSCAARSATRHLAADRERVGLVDVTTDLTELDPEEVLAAGEPLAGIDRDWAIAARDEHRERVSALLATLSARAGRAALGARGGQARPAVRGGGAAADDAARRRRRPGRGDVGLRAARGPARARAVGRAVAPDAPAAGRDPRGRGAAAGNRRPTPRLPPVKGPLPAATRSCGRSRTRPARSCSPASRGSARRGCWPRPAGSLHQRGRTVLYGRCYEEQVAPYEPFAEALGADTFAQLLADAAATSAGGSSRRSARASRGRVLLLDDLHWADAGTLRLLAHLLRRPKPPVVLGAYRDTEIAPHPPARRRARRPAPRRPRRARAAARPRRDRGGASSSAIADRAATLHRETGGNPFFVEQVLVMPTTACDPGRASRTSSAAASHGSLRRPAACSPSPPSAGREFDLALLEAVLGDVDALAALEEAAAAQMVREERPGRYAFAHALIRETLYDELSLTRRVRTHRALADALAQVPGHSARRTRPPPAPGGDAPGGRRHRARRRPRGDGRARLRGGGEPVRTGARGARGRAPAAPSCYLALGEAQLRAGEPAREAFAQAAALARTLPRPRAVRPCRARVQRARRHDHRRRPRGGRAARGGARSSETSLRARLRRAAGDRDLLRVDARAAQGARRRGGGARAGRRAARRARRSPRRAVERAVPRGAARHRERDARAGDRARATPSASCRRATGSCSTTSSAATSPRCGPRSTRTRRSPSGCGCRATRGGRRCGARRWRSSKAASPTPRP